jgi:Ca2+-transporting ATPase
MSLLDFNIGGLTSMQVSTSRAAHGRNLAVSEEKSTFLNVIKRLIKEPMLILLLVASTIYFISGQVGDGLFLACAIVFVAGISLYQDSRSRNALNKLKELSQPHSKVIRDGQIKEIASDEIVLGDSLMVEEGNAITADGTIVHSNDFSVNESILTGESLQVPKSETTKDNAVFQGTTVASGLAVVTVTAIGKDTRLGQIGGSLAAIKEEKTPLEAQINNFIKKMVFLGAIIFLLVWGINYYHTLNILASLLKALTLAMSILPEEIPVAFTTFMALGAFKMMQTGVIVKQMKTVETLGSATVICTDKTGTLTENQMALAKTFLLSSKSVSGIGPELDLQEKEMITVGMWASEPIPFDPMEIALHKYYTENTVEDERPRYKLIHEYPLSGTPPMMTHVFENESGQRIIAAKGAPEALVSISGLNEVDKKQISDAVYLLASDGYRVLGVGKAEFTGYQFPRDQQNFNFSMLGLIAFYDPPKENISEVLNSFYKAGIAVKIVTGDNLNTTIAIAKQIGFRGFEKHMTGEELMLLNDDALRHVVKEVNIFARTFPDAKLKIINALKSENEIVAMTGDGVNDGPALKAAHIGIAMGTKGTEIAKQAASLILINNDLAKMVDAVAAGRRIYANLKKAVQYIISIHIPVILTVFIPLLLGWIYPNIFSPVHIIFLELVMGPTCSIVYENEPIEKDSMCKPPRPFTTTFFKSRELITSIIQGLAITLGVLLVYQIAVAQHGNEALTRTMVFTTLITANIVLTLVNRSFYYALTITLRYNNNMMFWMVAITTSILALLLFVPPLTKFFEFEALSSKQIFTSLVIGMSSVIWYEAVKWQKRRSSKNLVYSFTSYRRTRRILR